jgi:hypothetical protein
MGLLDSLMGKGGKWFDCNKTLNALAGTLSRMPSPKVLEDGSLAAHLVPEDKSVLTNRNGKRNQNDMLELRVKPAGPKAQAYLDALKSMTDKKVWVTGALVNNDAKEGKAELHPLDVIWTRLPADLYPEWVKGMMTTLKDPDTEVQVFRLAAASHDAKTGASGGTARPLKLIFPYPAKSKAPNPELKYEVKSTAAMNADFQLNHERIRERLEFVMELKPSKAEGGLTLFVADLVMFWN